MITPAQVRWRGRQRSAFSARTAKANYPAWIARMVDGMPVCQIHRANAAPAAEQRCSCLGLPPGETAPQVNAGIF